ncbi:MAG: hypothetical protein RL739_2727 [Pseudomonadota bacterium]
MISMQAYPVLFKGRFGLTWGQILSLVDAVRMRFATQGATYNHPLC